jgi:predicted SPOUT superfamily RNA methylase MTH1
MHGCLSHITRPQLKPQAHERLPYREGVTLEVPNTSNGSNATAPKPDTTTTATGGSFVNVGLRKDVRLDRRLRAGVRVTVKLDPRHDPPSRGVAVAPSAPREEAGLYWGYATRVAKNLAEVFAGCPFKVCFELVLVLVLVVLDHRK